jgi:predicted N-acetyltransferase YhbS
VEIRPLTPDDDLTAQLNLGERAFGVMSPAAREGWLRRNKEPVADGRFFALFDGGRQVGGAAWHDMRQWWAGREVPMAGVASVKIAPEARGQGLGRQLMTEVLREIAARGYPLSALYPATSRPPGPALARTTCSVRPCPPCVPLPGAMPPKSSLSSAVPTRLPATSGR